MSEEIKALENVINEIVKIREKYKIKAKKERAKINDIYITIEGEKCYSEDDINSWMLLIILHVRSVTNILIS